MFTETFQSSGSSTCLDARSTNKYASIDKLRHSCIAEAEQAVNDGLIQDVTSVLDAARPVGEKRRLCAIRFAAEVCERLEAVICRAQQSDDGGTGAKRSCEVNSLSAVPAQKKAKTVGGMAPATSSSFQASEQTDLMLHSHLIQWISFQSSSEDPSTPASHEPEIQSGISALVGFVDEALAEIAADTVHDISMHKLSTFQKAESIATDNDSYQQFEVALTMDTGSCTDIVPDHKDAVMMVAVKQFAQEQHRACRYLAYCTRKLFTTQLNRRFAWGLTACGTTVRACLFAHDKVLSSEAMDVSTSDGRRVFVELLTNWTMCESWRLGYDPTIRYDADLKHWEIDAYDSETQLTRSYICENICCNAYSIFGRHTRCFVAREKTADPASAADQDSPKVLIKDSWTHPISPGSDVARDEVAYLREIRDELAKDNTLNGTYPRLEAGGMVQIMCSDGVADDTTQLILEDIAEDTRAKVLNRIHRRIVMSPVGEPIHNLKSIDELIVIVGDVMAAHTAIAKRCGLLHRDLSDNNIMFHRDANGGVKGMLVDFDNACRIADMENMKQPDCVGTLPFMSIGNLEMSGMKRTVLDDWESLIYILCWLGTVGISQADQDSAKAVRDLPIKNWHRNSATNIANSKRQFMHDEGFFVKHILQHILNAQGFEELRKLLFILRATLFSNKHVSSSAQGCLTLPPPWAIDMGIAQPKVPTPSDTQFLDRDVDPAITDSFARRAEIAGVIADELLGVTQKFR
ncbi:hypothetical protein LPJ54_003274, partial [Coemansia sp. RSA 1824]